MNVSGQRIQQIFNTLDRRLKSADKKEQSGVGGQRSGGRWSTEETQDKDNRTQRTS